MKNREDILKEVRQLVAKAKTEEALALLAEHVESEAATPADRSWRDALAALRSRWENLQYQERQQLIAPDQAARERSQIVHATLATVEKLEQGLPAPRTDSFSLTRERAEHTNRWLQWAMVGTVLIAVAVALVWWLNREPTGQSQATDEDKPPVAESLCPEFAEAADFNILILPFKPYRGNPSRAHLAIGDRLAQEARKYRLQASIRPLDLPVSEIDPYPVGAMEARQIASRCTAQLIIWGNTEPHPEGPSAGEVIRTDFAFAESDNFDFTLLELDGTANVATVQTLSSIVSSGRLTQSIEYNIQLLLGLIARESKQYAQTIEILEDLPIDTQDPTASTLQRMILADTYLKQEQFDAARRVYTDIVTAIPDYAIARNNLAMLYYRESDFEQAASQLDTLAELQPRDKDIARRQILANIKAGQLYKVSPLIDQATAEDTTDSPVRSEAVPQITREYELKETELKNEQRSAERILRTDPDNVKALETKARTAKNLGDLMEARQATDRLQRIDPNNRLVPELRDTVRLKLPSRNIRIAPSVNLERNG